MRWLPLLKKNTVLNPFLPLQREEESYPLYIQLFFCVKIIEMYFCGVKFLTLSMIMSSSKRMFICIFINLCLQSSKGEIRRDLHSWRLSGMCSLTKEYNPDSSSKYSTGVQYRCGGNLIQLRFCMNKYTPKRITSLIRWSIHMTRTVLHQCQITQRTCYAECGQNEYPSVGFKLCSSSKLFVFHINFKFKFGQNNNFTSYIFSF